MKIKHFTHLLLTLFLSTPSFAGGILNVRDFGAKGDGIHVDSEAVNKAIQEISKQGGGTIYFPAGKYMCGSIRLQSHIELQLGIGCEIIAIDRDPEKHYDQAEKPLNSQYQDFTHCHFQNSLIWAKDAEDIAITGYGRIYGKGLTRGYDKINGVWTEYNEEGKKYADKAITLLRCRNITLRDFTIFHGGWIGILLTGTDNVTIDNLKIDTNRDGIDIDCCQNVRVSNCLINAPDDDALVLKSSYGLGYGRMCENICITNCEVSGFDEGSVLDGTYGTRHVPRHRDFPYGRIKLGTESNEGFRNITISNCVFKHSMGLAIESVDGATVEDISISNITMHDVMSDPIFIRLGARMRAPKTYGIGSIQRIQLSNIIAHGVKSGFTSTITGIPGHNVKDIHFQNIRIYNDGGEPAGDCHAAVPENIEMYPDPGMFGACGAYGFFIRHAEGLTFDNIELRYLKEDKRVPIRMDDVKNIQIYRLDAQNDSGLEDKIIN